MEALKKVIGNLFNTIKSFCKWFMSLSTKRKIYFLGFSFIVFLILWAFISASTLTANFQRSQVKDGVDDQKVDAIGIIITETKEGKKYFEIYGEDGKYNNDENIAVLNNVVGNFYKDNEVAMSFQSTKGSYDEKAGTITLYENTYIVLKDGVSLEADKLTWFGSDKDTIAEGNVKIQKGKDMIATADKCVIGVGYTKFKIVGKSQTKLFSDKEK